MRPKAQDPLFPWLGPDEGFRFPDPSEATTEGILATGGNLSPGMLLSAYRQGVFPWFADGEPLLWWSPDPRFVLFPDELHVADRLRRYLKRSPFALSLDLDFGRVIEYCANMPRPGQRGTWITLEMQAAYRELHELGFAHSVEVWLGDELVGGLYGVSLGAVFFGESMFSIESNASRTGFIALCLRLKEEGFALIDSQVHTENVASLGGRHIPRTEYLMRLEAALRARPDLRGDWAKLLPGFPASRGLEAMGARIEARR
jgi:leucyl/phenylalanyl-tRNA--protein transferase